MAKIVGVNYTLRCEKRFCVIEHNVCWRGSLLCIDRVHKGGSRALAIASVSEYNPNVSAVGFLHMI